MKPIIDISHHQDPKNISYDRIVENTAGVILRAAYGAQADRHLDTHYYEIAIRRKHPVGTYHFITQYHTVQSQVDRLRTAIDGKVFQMKLWTDVERENGAEALQRQQVINYINAVEAQLRKVDGIYTSKTQWQAIMNGIYFNDKLLWAALYGTNIYNWLPQGWSDYWLWQYSSTGKVDGYNGNLDMNRFRFDETVFNEWIGNAEPVEPDEVLYQAKCTATANLRVRSGAGLGFPVSAPSILYGTIVEVYEVKSGWCRHNKGGWSDGQWLERINDDPEPDPIPTNPKVLAQRDPRWANVKLGYSPTITIGQQGCLITSLTMVLNHYGYNETPSTVNAKLQDPKIHGFVAGQPNMYWKSPLAVWSIDYPVWREPWFGKTDLNEINTWLAKGAWALVHVDLDLETYAVEQHWVVLTERVGDDYRTLDPWQGDEILFSTRFGTPSQGIYRVCIYSKAVK